MESTAPQLVEMMPRIWVVVVGLVLCFAFLRLLSAGRLKAAALLVAVFVGIGVLCFFVRTARIEYVRSEPQQARHMDAPLRVSAPLANLQSGAVPAVTEAEPAEIPLPSSTGEEPSTAEGEKPAAEPRPDWVGKPGRLAAGKYQVAVKSGLYVTVAECQRALEAAERLTVADYVESYLGDGAGKLAGVGDDYTRSHLEREQFLEPVQSSVGSMQQLHALLVIDDDARHDFRQRWRAALVRQRLWLVGGGGALVFFLLATSFGYLVASGRRNEPAGAAR